MFIRLKIQFEDNKKVILSCSKNKFMYNNQVGNNKQASTKIIFICFQVPLDYFNEKKTLIC